MTTTTASTAGAFQRADARFYVLFLSLAERRGIWARRGALLARAAGCWMLALLEEAGLRPRRRAHDRWRGMARSVSPLVIGDAA